MPIAVLLTILLIPPIQTFLAQKASEYFSKITGFQIYFEKLRINPINQNIFLKNLRITDRQNHEMLFVEKTEIDLYFATFLQGNDVFLEKISLNSGAVNLVVNPQNGQLNIDEFIAVIDSLTAPQEKRKHQPREKSPIFSIEEIILEKMVFSYQDSRKDSIHNGFDYSHFRFSDLNAYIQNFLIVADTVAFSTNSLEAIDKQSRLHIKNFTTHFLMNKHSMQFNKLYAEINNSTLRDSLVFNYESDKDFGEFNEKVRLEVRLVNTILYTQDLALFAPELKKYDDVWQISGEFSGSVNNFIFNNFSIKLGQKTHLTGSLTAEGLPQMESLLASLQIEPGSNILATDLKQYFDENIYPYVEKLQEISLQGRFDGYFNNFKINTQLQTNLGDAIIEATFAQGISQLPVYEATVHLQNFALGKFLEISTIGLISVDLNIQGEGLSLKTLKTQFEAHLDFFEINNYPLHNITLEGSFQEKLLKLSLESQDPNAYLEFFGYADFTSQKTTWRLSSYITNIDFFQLHLLKEPLHFQGLLYCNSESFSSDDFLGEFTIRDAQIRYKNKILSIDSLGITSSQNPYGYRFIELYSPYVTGEITGKYTLNKLQQKFNIFINELILGIKNQEEKQKIYYQTKAKDTQEDIIAEFKINLFDINPVVQIWDSTFQISQDITLIGMLESREITRLRFSTEKPFEKLHIGRNHFQRNNFRFEAYKENYNENISAELNLYSNHQQWGTLETETLSLSAIWIDGIIDFKAKIKQKNTSNEADLQGYIRLDTNRTEISFEKSLLKILNKEWYFYPEGKITLFTDQPGKIAFEKFGLHHQTQSIQIQGTIGSVNDSLNIDIGNLQFSTLNALLYKQKLQGTLNAHINLKDIYNEIKINSKLNVYSLYINQFLVGDLQVRSFWNNDQKILEIIADVYHKKEYVLLLTGYYKPQDQSLNLISKIQNLPLNIVEPFTEGLFSKLEGRLWGNLAITGKVYQPQIAGFAKFQNAKLKIDFLGATYETNSQIEIIPNEFRFSHFILKDKENQKIIFDGNITHENFSHFFLNLEGDFEKFTLLQIKEAPNVLFYGNAIATGKILIQGELTDLYIRVDATSNKGTKIYLPLDGYNEVGEASYYQFVDFEKADKQDTLYIQRQIKSVKITGLELDMNLNVTEDAYFEIQLDRQTGDKMQAIGKGIMQLSLDRRGNFNIWGDYLISDGSYFFTMKNLVSKKFTLLAGSKIYFEGDVFKAYMDVKAAYNANTSFTAFLAENEINPETSRRFPVAVVAHLLGDLLAPKVTFSIDFKDIDKQVANPTLQAAILKVKADIENNELELNRQVGSLVILGQFTSASNNSSVGAASGRTLGEFLSNQFSNIVSQIDENLEIDITAGDLIAAGQNNSTVLGARFAYNLMDGRLRIISDNRFNNQQQGSNYTGEWIVEYLITEDGRYKLKMYNRSTFGNSSIMNTTANTTGVSISASRSGNTFWELFQSKKKKEAKRKQNQSQR